MDEMTTYFDNIFQMNRKTTEVKKQNMERKINEFITYIKGQNLSPIEQVMLVYDKVKLYECVSDDTIETRQCPDVLSSGKAVCAGYVNVFNEILGRLGYKTAVIESYIGNVSHMTSIVEVNDEKYGINGIYNFDPTFDSLDKDKKDEDRLDSYAFFCKSNDEIRQLREQRISRGCSKALTDDVDNNYNEIIQDIPTRTMNIINGFFPSEENKEYLSKIYQDGADKNNWQTLNEPYMMQLANLGFKFRRAERVDPNVIEQVIRTIRKIELPDLSETELEDRISSIKQFNNDQFVKYFNDSRIPFKMPLENEVTSDNYADYLAKLNELIATKKDEEHLISVFNINNDNFATCEHMLQKISENDIQVLLSGNFEYNYDFTNKVLNNAVADYSKQCPYLNSKIKPPETFNLNIRDYMALSQNNVSLCINNAHLDYLTSIDNVLRTNQQNNNELENSERKI